MTNLNAALATDGFFYIKENARIENLYIVNAAFGNECFL